MPVFPWKADGSSKSGEFDVPDSGKGTFQAGGKPFSAWLFNAVMHGGSHGNQQERSAYPEEDGTGSVSVLRPDVLHELQEGNMQQEDGIGQEAGPVGQMDEHRWNFNSRRLRGFCK